MKQLDIYGAKVEELYNYMEGAVFEEIAKSLRKALKTGGKVSVAEWQVLALQETGQLNERVIKRLAAVTGVTESTIRQAIFNAGRDVIDDVDRAFRHQLPPADNPMLTVMEAYVQSAVFNLDNLVNQSLISNNVAGQIYTDIINQSTAEVLAGNKSLERAVSDTVSRWVDTGIPSGFTDKGGRTWSVENYAKTTIRTTVRNAADQVRYQRMDDYGIYTVVVPSHPSAREACAKIQGQVVDLRPQSQVPPGSKYRSIYDPFWGAKYKEPDGHHGINCSHPHIPFNPEFNVNNQAQIDPQGAIDKEAVYQRRNELARRIRRSKKHITTFEALGDDKKTAYYKKLLNKQRKGMVKYTRDHDLKRDYSLESVDVPDEQVIREVKASLKKR